MPRRAPGPRTAAAYAYDYGFPIGGRLGAAAATSGTDGQRELLAHVRRNQEAVEAVRNNPPRRGAHHNVDPTAAANQEAPTRALAPVPTIEQGPVGNSSWVAEVQANMEAARGRLATSRQARARGAIQMGDIPGAPRPASAIPLGRIMPTVSQDPGETWAQRQRRQARRQGVHQGPRTRIP